MVVLVITEALRRIREGRREVRPGRGRVPLWRLLAGELAHLARAAARRPAVLVVASGAALAAGLVVALGEGYPGPVAASPLRWSVAALALVAVGGLARAVPPTWAEVRRGLWMPRTLVAGVLTAGLVSLVKVGLHDTTAGPVLPAPGRWVAVVVLAALVAVLTLRPDTRA